MDERQRNENEDETLKSLEALYKSIQDDLKIGYEDVYAIQIDLSYLIKILIRKIKKELDENNS